MRIHLVPDLQLWLQGWEFAHSLFALLLKMAHFNEQPIVICSCLSLQKSDYELFAQVTHDKRMMEQFTLFTS